MAFFAGVPTLVCTAILGPDSTSPADLSRVAFGVLLWIVLVVMNRRLAVAPVRPLELEVGAVPRPTEVARYASGDLELGSYGLTPAATTLAAFSESAGRALALPRAIDPT